MFESCCSVFTSLKLVGPSYVPALQRSAPRSAPLHLSFGPLRSVFRSAHAPLIRSGGKLRAKQIRQQYRNKRSVTIPCLLPWQMQQCKPRAEFSHTAGVTGPGWAKAAREQTLAAQSITPFIIWNIFIRIFAASFNCFPFFGRSRPVRDLVPLATSLIQGRLYESCSWRHSCSPHRLCGLQEWRHELINQYVCLSVCLPDVCISSWRQYSPYSTWN